MRNKIFSYQSLHTDLAALLLRIIVGGLFFAHHGYQKISNYDKILPMMQDIIGIGAKLSFNLVIFAEFFCAFFVLVGFLTRLTIIPILITMGVAFFIAHGKDPFDVKTLPLVYLLLSIVIFVLGSGKFSVDRLIFKNKR
ncbi:MAG TPA: DoxX family protein, partial [Chitinophagaceae bacterium]|nr:DoxX family protein [Chitinophagaceae bacterium]